MGDMQYNILVIAVSSNVTVGILRALREQTILNVKIIGACISPRAAGFVFCDEWLLCPLASDPTFSSWIEETCDIFGVNAIVSSVEEVLSVLASLDMTDKGVVSLVHTQKSIRDFTNKIETSNWFADHELAHPKTLHLTNLISIEELESEISYPWIVKPVLGKGSSDIHVVNDRSSINEQWFVSGKMLAQELIGSEDEEYTCGVFVSMTGKTVVLVQKRYLKGGSTCYSEIVQSPQIESYCKKIAAHINEPGAFNIQLRIKSDGSPVCFEVNLRLSGTTYIRHKFGFRDCLAWLAEKLGESVDLDELFEPTEAVIAIRYEAEVFFEADHNFRLWSLEQG